MSEEEAQWLFAESKKNLSHRVIALAFFQRFEKDVSPATISRYRSMEEFSLEKGGRNEIIDAAVEKDLLQVFHRIRSTGTCVDSGLVCAIASGLTERRFKGSTHMSGGVLLFSPSWAQKWMHKHDINVRKPTTDRTVPNDVIVADGRAFYAELEKHREVDPRDTYNMDEFFCTFDSSQKHWTWEHCPRGEKKNIVVREARAGFTCSVTTAASGEVVLIQFIHKGTHRVHVEGLEDMPNVLQCSREGSHFQNESTFAEWCAKFKAIAEARRRSPTDRILLLLDIATQHGEAAKLLPGIDIVKIPPKQTHVFQPADQYVIACLKGRAKKLFSAWIATQFRDCDLETAIAEVNTTSVPVTRKRKVHFICQAAEELGKASVVKSWEKTGIPRALWQTPSAEVLYDLYVQAKELLGPVQLHDEEPASEPDTPAAPVQEKVGAKRGRPKLNEEEKESRKNGKSKPAPAHNGKTLMDYFKKKQ